MRERSVLSQSLCGGDRGTERVPAIQMSDWVCGGEVR